MTKEERKAYDKAYREAHREERKAYREAHREERNCYHRKRRARKRKALGEHDTHDIQTLYEIQGGKCLKCKAALHKKGKQKFHVDHIIPLSSEMLTTYNGVDNLQLLCPTCNLGKHTKIIDYRTKTQKRRIAVYLQQTLLV